MPITNLPTFTEKQLLTAAQLNQIVTALQTKFAGNIAGADLVWPLVTDGDIDFGGQHGLLNLPQLWNVTNASEYDTFADAVSALPTSGGAIYIPGGTTVSTDGVIVTGKDICIYGAGSSSKLKLTGAASSGYLLRHSGNGSYRFQMHNLVVDGQNTGSAQDGIQLRQPLSAKVHGVTFRNFTGRAMWITNSGSPGFYADNVQISQCLFEGGTLNCIEANDVQMLQVTGCQFDNPSQSGVYVVPTNSSYYGKHIKISNNIFKSCVNSIYVNGVGTALDNQWGFITITDNIIESETGDGITAGIVTAQITKCMIRGNIVDSPSGDGIHVCSHYGSVVDNIIYAAGANGIDMISSKWVQVKNNQARTAGAYGIDMGNSSYCLFSGNDVSNATTEGIGSADIPIKPYLTNNLGGGGVPKHDMSFNVGYSGGSGNSSGSTIPAKTFGDVYNSMILTAQIGYSGGSGSATVELKLAGSSVGTATIANGESGVAIWQIAIDVGGLSDVYTTSPNAAGDAVANTNIDWDSDVAVTFTVTAGGGGTVVINVAQLHSTGWVSEVSLG
jgi:parallel beta-helix repeat protein